MTEQIGHADRGELRRMEAKSLGLAQEIDRVAQDSHDFSLEFGQGGRISAGERLELGRHLARNRKLGELARLVGRFKQDARALRRKTMERGVAEAYDIERGSELGRLIPAELLAMHHPGLRRDFGRRLLEGELLQYRLRAEEQKGKGPMVVCIDVSSSMEGDKELWAKAVSLTLMDIARRQRRLFRAVLFSSGPGSLKVLDLNQQAALSARAGQGDGAGGIFSWRRHRFPGADRCGDGSHRAEDGCKPRRHRDHHRRRDARSRPNGWPNCAERKEELQFSIFAVLVDVGSSELSTLAQISDRVTSVKKLSAEGTREIFMKI